MIFKKINLEDKDLFHKYIIHNKFLSSEFSFTSLYIWKDICDIQYTIFEDALIIKRKDFKGNICFMQPLGYKEENLKKIIDEIMLYKNHNKIDNFFQYATEDFVNTLKSLYIGDKEFIVEEDRDNFDYVYNSKCLASLSGRHLHKKKNHYNSFIKKYTSEVFEISSDEKILNDVKNAAIQWYKENGNEDAILYSEMQGILNILPNLHYLNLQGIAVYIEGVIAGFTIGERFNDKMAIIHIEKGSKDFIGVYNYINKIFVEKYYSDVELINREQDLGIEGIRKAKLSYHPLSLEKKFIVK